MQAHMHMLLHRQQRAASGPVDSSQRRNVFKLQRQQPHMQPAVPRTSVARHCRHLTLATSSSAASTSVSDKYLEWAAAAGIESAKVAQAQFGELRGAKALADIPPNEPFITVPRSAALVVTPQQRCPDDSIDAAYWKSAPWYVKMALLLLLERRQGSGSRVWGYIQQLPASIDTPVRWSEDDLAQLQYKPAIREIRQQQRQWRQQYEGLQGALKKGSPAVSWEDDFLWALENVRSRAFSGPYTGATFKDKLTAGAAVLVAGGAYVTLAHLPLQQALNGLLAALMFNIIYDVLLSQKLKWYAMCPVIDACNHSSTVESEVAYEYFRDAFALSIGTEAKAGQQVLISYGVQANDSLLQYYGFVEAGNPNDTYVLEVPVGSSGQSAKVAVNAKGSVNPEGLTALAAALQQQQQPSDDGAVWKAVSAAAEAELSRLPTTAADDTRLLATPHLLSPRARLAVQFRLEKKKLLEKCVGKAGKRAKKKAGQASKQ